MIDYVTLMLANMVAGLAVLASFVIWGLDRPNQKAWAPAFATAGLVATVCGLVMTFTWPLPKPYSMAFGEPSVLFGVLLLGAAGALAIGADLQPLGIYAALPGVVAILIGVRIMQLSLTGSPILAGIGFILTGAGGLGAWITVRKRQVRVLRYAGAAILLGAAAIWTLTALLAYWYHMVPPASP
jgi:putative membrane protein